MWKGSCLDTSSSGTDRNRGAVMNLETHAEEMILLLPKGRGEGVSKYLMLIPSSEACKSMPGGGIVQRPLIFLCGDKAYDDVSHNDGTRFF